MNITLNNKTDFFDIEEISFSELMIQKNFTFRMIVTKLNGILVSKNQRETTFIKEGDVVVVLHLVSGG